MEKTRQCLDCKTEMILEEIDGNTYFFCLKCNPQQLAGQAQSGYWGCCRVCFELTCMHEDDHQCADCNSDLCLGCVKFWYASDDDSDSDNEDVKVCPECKKVRDSKRAKRIKTNKEEEDEDFKVDNTNFKKVENNCQIKTIESIPVADPNLSDAAKAEEDRDEKEKKE